MYTKSNNTHRYVIYARKSTESDDKQMASIEDQLKEMRRIADEYSLNVVEVITESKSAKEVGRKGFNSMLETIKSGKADAVLCWKLNRLARNPEDGGKIISYLQKNIIKHIQVFGREYRPTDNMMMLYVELGMANQYVLDLSVDTKRGMRNMAERGWYPASQLPIGYSHNKLKQIGMYEIVQNDDIYIIQKLFNMIITQKVGISEIHRKSIELGLRNSNNKPYSLNTIRLTMSHEFYCGYYYWSTANGVKIRHKGKHETILTEEDFKLVQKVLGNYKKCTRDKKYQFPFNGSFHCGECNCVVGAEHKLQCICTNCRFKFSMKNIDRCPKCNTKISKMASPSIIDKTYYQCSKRRGKCNQGGVEDTELRKYITKELEDIYLPKRFVEWAIDVYKSQENSNDMGIQASITKNKKRITELGTEIDGLIRMKAQNSINDDTFNRLFQESEREQKTLITDLENLQSEIIDWSIILSDYLNFGHIAVELFSDKSIRAEKSILACLGENLTILDKKPICTMPLLLSALKQTSDEYTLYLEQCERKKAPILQGTFSHKQHEMSIGLPR